MTITIRPITDLDGCYHFQELERRVWASPENDIVPVHLLITVIKNGGGVLGAFAEDGPSEMGGLVGAAFWWPGIGQEVDGKLTLKMCSHVVGVLPDWQRRRIGLQLKLAQRDVVLAQGFTDWITWTYDPLYRPNGVFNIHRLGATCNTYLRNVYGELQDALNRGLPSDRCQVDWRLTSARVLRRLDPQRRLPKWDLAVLQMLPTVRRDDGLVAPIEEATLSLDGRPVAVPIPHDIGAIRAQDSALSVAWRMYMRQVLETTFAAGYAMVDCVHVSELGWHYILTREPM